MKKNKKKAFTLPEILVALMVIGTLTSIIIPIIKNSYQRNTTQASFANTYKEINQALFKYSRNNNGQGKLSATPLFSDENIAHRITTVYNSARKVGTNCWNGISISNNINGGNASTDLSKLSCFIDDRGTIYAYEASPNNCSTDLYDGTLAKNKLKNSCGYVYFDINGTKAPNAFGKDVFMFVITDNAPSYLYPMGGKLINKNNVKFNLEYWNSNTNKSCGMGSAEGRTCAARIIDEGWKIKYFK